MRVALLAAVCLTACASAGDAPPGAPDAAADAAGPDGAPCATWFLDSDGDGHGDPSTAVTACEAPASTVATGDDCDDGDGYVHPGAAELCDGVDTDCAAATVESCPVGCTPRVHPGDGHPYLFCAGPLDWANALGVCAAHGQRLVRVDDAGEDDWLRTTADQTVGALSIWLGANDRDTEGQWRWPDGATFWQGGAVGGLFSRWDAGEPNDADGEDCAELRAAGLWNDLPCALSQAFACERY